MGRFLRGESLPAHRVFAEFPIEIGPWKGKLDSLESIVLDALKLDDYVIADYVNDKGESVNFYAAYYASQRAGESAHSPRSCLPGGGWVMEEIEQKALKASEPGSQALRFNRVVIKKGEYTQLVYYWFQQRGRSITNEYLVKWYLLLDAINKNRTDGSLIRLTTLVGPGQDIANADTRLMNFMNEALPYFPEYFPD